jgi:TRAP-type C4-dicarboxylate transport system permease small subunit
MRAFERIVSRVAFVVDGAAAVFLAIITTLTFVAVLMRYVFNLPFPGSFDVSRLLLGVAIFWGIAAAAWRGEHIQVDILWQFLPVRAQRALDLFADIVFCIFIAGITWMLYWQVWRVQASRQTTFEMSIQIWPFYGIAWLGIAFCFLVLLARILRAIINFNAPITESTAAQS